MNNEKKLTVEQQTVWDKLKYGISTGNTFHNGPLPSTYNIGDVWYDTVDDQLEVFDGSTWIVLYTSV